MKFTIQPSLVHGLTLCFTNEKGSATCGFNGPPKSISHVDISYLQEKFWNVSTQTEVDFIKREYQKEIQNYRKKTG